MSENQGDCQPPSLGLAERDSSEMLGVWPCKRLNKTVREGLILSVQASDFRKNLANGIMNRVNVSLLTPHLPLQTLPT